MAEPAADLAPHAMNTDTKAMMKDLTEAVTRLMDELLPPASGPRNRVIEAMRYGCLGGGKRLRPFLVVASADLFDVPHSRSLRVGAALEMIHSYSLIHDDLPAMDDSDLRRGRPSAHKAFDEATAILAGDGLLTHAFGIIAKHETHPEASVRVELIEALSEAAGQDGMVGGQMIDIAAEHMPMDLDGITELQRLKTGALIRYGCVAGGILGQAAEADRLALSDYAAGLGLAFQLVDDLLDAFGDAAALGKPIGQDQDMDKATFVKLLGADGTRKKAEELVESASARLDRFGPKAAPLRDIAGFVLNRKN